MAKCFVIQPFDKDIYDLRYNDVFKPAIAGAGLEPYRVDQDPAVIIPINDIGKGIEESVICFADITTNNPNVWYELGYAFACGKEVVMVSCDKERVGKFPFDIQHRSVIQYDNGSKSDFEKLEGQITTKLKAYLKSKKTVERISETPIVEQEGLKGHEIAALLIILGEAVTTVESFAVYRLKDEMKKAGYTDVAAGVSLISLQRKGMIGINQETDFNGNEYAVASILEKGQDWIIQNQNKLEFRAPKVKEEEVDWEPLPF